MGMRNQITIRQRTAFVWFVGFFCIATFLLINAKAWAADGPGGKQILQMGYLGGNTVYLTQKGQEPIKNDLVIYIKSVNNTPGEDNPPIPARANTSYIKIFFEYGNGLGDLTSKEDAVHYELDLLRNYGNEFHVKKEIRSFRPYWKLTPTSDVFLQGGSNNRIELKISNVFSTLAPGFTTVHMEYGDIPGYEDGALDIELIKKKPLPIAVKRDKPLIAYFIGLKKGQPVAKFNRGETISLKWGGNFVKEYKLLYEDKELGMEEKTDYEIPEGVQNDTTFILKAVNDFGEETYQTLSVNIINPDLAKYFKRGDAIVGEHLKFEECGGRYACTPRACLAKCIDLGMRMATYSEVYGWASAGRDHCAYMWMLHPDKSLVRAYPMYHNQTTTNCGRVNTGNIPRMEGFAADSWDSKNKFNCACSTLK